MSPPDRDETDGQFSAVNGSEAVCSNRPIDKQLVRTGWTRGDMKARESPERKGSTGVETG